MRAFGNVSPGKEIDEETFERVMAREFNFVGCSRAVRSLFRKYVGEEENCSIDVESLCDKMVVSSGCSERSTFASTGSYLVSRLDEDTKPPTFISIEVTHSDETKTVHTLPAKIRDRGHGGLAIYRALRAKGLRDIESFRVSS